MPRKNSMDLGKEIRWSGMCRTLRIFGHMKDYSKAEVFRIHGLLTKAIEVGRAVKVRRGVYRRILIREDREVNLPY